MTSQKIFESRQKSWFVYWTVITWFCSSTLSGKCNTDQLIENFQLFFKLQTSVLSNLWRKRMRALPITFMKLFRLYCKSYQQPFTIHCINGLSYRHFICLDGNRNVLSSDCQEKKRGIYVVQHKREALSVFQHNKTRLYAAALVIENITRTPPQSTGSY